MAAKGKHSVVDPLIPLIIGWNRGETVRQHFNAVRVLNVKEMSWDAFIEIKNLNIDAFQPEDGVFPIHTRGYILNHLVRHLEALALLSFWELDTPQGEPILSLSKPKFITAPIRTKPEEVSIRATPLPIRKSKRKPRIGYHHLIQTKPINGIAIPQASSDTR
jgi:hypothetical protein